jgi:cytochrome c oxidase subunit 1
MGIVSSIHGKLALLWISIVLILFLVTGSAGFLMRISQAGVLSLDTKIWYSLLTFHGQANAVIFFLAPLMLSRALLSHYLDISSRISILSSVIILLGIIGVAASILLGGMSMGWYFLYPLPFYEVSTGYLTAWILSVLMVGIGILILALDGLRASIRKYGLEGSMAWGYIAGSVTKEIPPIVLISTVGNILVVISIASGAVLLTAFLLQNLGMIRSFDALGAKNLTFMFGHTLVNTAIVYAIASIYESMPSYSKRPWKTALPVALAWNIVLIAVILAMFHHVFMDFVQPRGTQILGHIFSYVAALPALAVTVLGALSHIGGHRLTDKNFHMVPAFILAGILAWVIGGAAAVIDATIPANFLFHNTTWVPAHFHTYFGYGVVIMVIAITWHLLREKGFELSRSFWLPILLIITIGFALHLASFYIGGLMSIPRRFAEYLALPGDLKNIGSSLAILSASGAVIYAIGYVPLLYLTLRSAYKAIKG